MFLHLSSIDESISQVSVGPFTIIKTVDRLFEAVADMLSAERTVFTLSTKNIGIVRPLVKKQNSTLCQCQIEQMMLSSIITNLEILSFRKLDSELE